MGIFRNDEDGENSGQDEASENVIPLLPLRDIVVFPHMVVPLFVGRTRSIAALEEAMEGDRQLLLCAQREAAEDEPTEDDIYEIGTIGSIIQLLRLPDGTVKVLVEGTGRARISRFASSDPFFESVMLDLMYEIPSRDDVEECVINEEVIVQGAKPLMVLKQEAESA